MPTLLRPRFRGWEQDSHLQFALQTSEAMIVVMPALNHHAVTSVQADAIDAALNRAAREISAALQMPAQPGDHQDVLSYTAKEKL